MKFIIDAQLPKRLSLLLISCGFDSIHTSELEKGNFTTDKELIEISIRESRIVITKDSDFYNSFLQKAEPYKLIFLKVGNASTDEILAIFSKNMELILDYLTYNFVIEIGPKNIIVII
ncbi:MAG TPA: DUF5615 family PIN-like protein [Saprospiraceae bacterium]|nr:DUF5615 family PIN-like protein [Saprospiraceae bacterium]